MEQQKKIHVISPSVSVSEDIKNKYRQKRVAAYCRVSTQQEEQINSYEVQTRYYTEKINAEPKWKLVKIFADKGISGTSTKHCDEFNKMIRMCKRGKIDMIVTKSISRFARNTVDCLKYIRMLRDMNIDIYFEEQGIHSIEKGSEFYITVYGSLAQSESENISANVRWGKEQCAKEGNVQFRYKNTLGYRKGDDGNPEIVPEEAETIQFIYHRFLAGDSYGTIKSALEEKGIPSPAGKGIWSYSTIRSILTNERYKQTQEEMRVLSVEEQNKLILYLLTDMDNYKFGTLFALMTGLRIGEVCALRCGDISLKEKTVTVRETMRRVKNLDGGTKTKIIFTKPKTNTSARVVPLTKAAFELCREHMNRANPGAFFLTGSEGKYIEPRTLQYKIKEYGTACDIENIHFHALRHTFATRCVEVGFEIKSLSEVLGHATPRITLERYVHSSIEFRSCLKNKYCTKRKITI